MSGFAVVYERTNTPVEPGVLVRITQKLNHRGPDGYDEWCSGSIAMGHWHFWTTPEETGEKQPLKLPGLPYTIVLDGRLDNRTDLLNRLNLSTKEANHLSDAVLILQAYDRWNTDCFKDLIGDFAFVIWDENHKEMVCARDAIGDRSLFYTFRGSLSVIASEPAAISAGVYKNVELDEIAIGYHFSMRIPEDGRTIFKGIYELLPAHWLKIGQNAVHTQRYWQPDLTGRNPKPKMVGSAEEFREVLETSISSRLRSLTPPAVMLSGGLDSSTIACMSARLLAPDPLCTISYVFDKFSECDERQYIKTIKEQYHTHSIQIPCDDLLPFSTWPEWPLDPNAPSANPYSLLLERTYQRAQEEGVRVLLTGMFGDNLYSMSSNWLADLFWDGKMSQLGEEIHHLMKKPGYGKLIKSRAIWQAIKQIFVRLPGFDHFHRKATAPNWLTPYGASLLQIKSVTKGYEKTHPLLNRRDATGASREVFNANRYNLDLRFPYHDRRLIEFVLGLPAYMLYSKGMTRRILRDSTLGILPESIRFRADKTNLLSLYNFGFQQRRNNMENQVFSPNAIWRKYINESVLLREWQSDVTKQSSGANSLLPCLCVLFQLWYNLMVTSINSGGTNGIGKKISNSAG